jgi:hypothetical protein
MTDADIMGEPEEIEFTAMVSMYRRLWNKETTAGALGDMAAEACQLWRILQLSSTWKS